MKRKRSPALYTALLALAGLVAPGCGPEDLGPEFQTAAEPSSAAESNSAAEPSSTAPGTAMQTTAASVSQYPVPIYQYHAAQNDGWRFRFSMNPFLAEGWSYDGPVFWALRHPEPGAIPIYEHVAPQGDGVRMFYTPASSAAGWNPTGVAFYAYNGPGAGRMPIYIYYYIQADGGWRFYYSTSPNVGGGWTYAGPYFWVPIPSGGPQAPVNIQPYWARSGKLQTYRRSDGSVYSYFRFTTHTSGPFMDLYRSVYDQGTPGSLVTWQKTYPKGSSYCTPTYGMLWFGQNDASVIEVGDWFAGDGCNPDRAFGYRDFGGTRNVGLTWSPPGGVPREISIDQQVRAYTQSLPDTAYKWNGYDVYSSVVLLGHYDTWTAPYGRDSAGVWRAGAGKTYNDVVHIVLYHGTRSPEQRAGTAQPTRCGPAHVDPAWPRAALYRPFPTYQSYAIELHLARGIGVVKESLLFNESSYWGEQNVCRGNIMGYDHDAAEKAWAAYLD